MIAKKAFILVLALLIVNDATAQSFRYDTRGRLISNNTTYDPSGQLMASGDKTYRLPQLVGDDYHFGSLTYNVATAKIKPVQVFNVHPYANIHQEPIKLTGGLYYLKAREYMPSIKRFVQMDSWDVSNRYLYAKGNPIKYNDPNGHMPKILKWFIPTTLGETLSLIAGFALAGIGDWVLITKLIPGKGKLATLTISGLFNGVVNAGAGYLGNGLESKNWHDLKRLGTDFGLGLVEGLVVGHFAHEKGVKIKLKKNEAKLKDDLRFSKYKNEHVFFPKEKSVKKMNKRTLHIKSKSDLNITSIGEFNLPNPTESMFKKESTSMLKREFIFDISNSQFTPFTHRSLTNP